MHIQCSSYETLFTPSNSQLFRSVMNATALVLSGSLKTGYQIVRTSCTLAVRRLWYLDFQDLVVILEGCHAPAMRMCWFVWAFLEG